MNTLKKTVLLWCGGVFSVAVFIMLLTFGIFLIGNKTQGYYSFAGERGIVIQDSMMDSKNNYIDTLPRGEMALFRTDFDANRDITKGQIILFRKKVGDTVYVSARRVSKRLVKVLAPGVSVVTYEVSQDVSQAVLPFEIAPSEVLGIYSTKNASLGGFFTFLNSFTGYMVLLLLPGAFAIGVAIFLVFSVFRRRN